MNEDQIVETTDSKVDEAANVVENTTEKSKKVVGDATEKIRVKYNGVADVFITDIGKFDEFCHHELEVAKADYDKLEQFVKDQLIKL